MSGRDDIIKAIHKCAVMHAGNRALMPEGSMRFWFNEFKEEVIWRLWDADPDFVGGTLTTSEWATVQAFYNQVFTENDMRLKKRAPRRSKRP